MTRMRTEAKRARSARVTKRGSRLRASCAAARIHRGGEFFQHGFGRLPRHARISDALAVGDGLAWLHVLAAFDEVALDHDACNAAAATGHLLCDVVGDDR